MFEKKHIDLTDDVVENENETEAQEEETEMKTGFFARHKKGILIGAGVAALAAIGGLVAGSRRSDDFEDYEDLDDDVDTPSDDSSSAE